MQNEKKFYFNLNHVQYIYPSQVLKNVPDLGVLNEFKDKFYTEKEVNEIVAMLIQRVPYIPNSMRIKVNVMYAGSYYHILEFKNIGYSNQTRGTTVDAISYKYEI